jgi:DNA-binding PadR family transcriptional regulator
MLSSYDEPVPENARLRKYYRITKAGRKLLQDKKDEWEIYSSAINSIMDLIMGTRGENHAAPI